MIDIVMASARIGKIQILHDINLHVAAGTMVSLIGANGAGKTTLLRLMSRVLAPSTGSITFDGSDLEGVPPQQVAARGLIHVPQGRQIIPGLTVEQNLLIGASHVRTDARIEWQADIDREYQRFPVLYDRRHVPGSALSGGEQQMLAVSRALMMRPKALMLDEPSLGLAPKIATRIFDALIELRRQGMTIILVEQAALQALAISDAGFVLQNGRIVLAGNAGDLLSDRKLVEYYLS